jgi:signal transduction histidine kinase
MNRLAWELRSTDLPRAIILAEEAKTLASQGEFEAVPYYKGLAESLVNLGNFNQKKGDYQIALSQSFEALALCEEFDEFVGQAKALGTIGFVHTLMGSHPEALEYHLKQLKISELLGDREQQASALNGIGVVYIESGDYEQALQEFEKSLQIDRELGDSGGEVIRLNNCAFASFKMEEYENTLAYGFQGLHLAQDIGYDYGEGLTRLIIADAYSALEQYDKALGYYKENLHHLQSMDHHQVLLDTLLSLGQLYIKQNQATSALAYLYQALDLAKEMKTSRHRCHEALAQAYKLQDDFERALDHYEKFHLLEKEVFNQDADNKLKNLEVVHRTEVARKEAAIYQLKNVELEQEITERKRIEVMLQKINDELEQRVKERTEKLMMANKQLRQAKDIAESANKAKSEFLATMSHELRTPLNHIIGFTELIVDKNFGELNEVQEEYLNDVLSSSRHLLSLINDILDLSKIESGKMELEPTDVDLQVLLENSLIIIKAKAITRKISLETKIDEIPESIHVDGRKFKQILYNLLSNAVKFTPHGGVICLSAKQVTRDEVRGPDSVFRALISSPLATRHSPSETEKFLEISVSDTGIGIKHEDLSRIFNPFEQVEQTASRRYQGTGLGLVLTKTFVELHGGAIWAESEGAGKGSTFTVILPI